MPYVNSAAGKTASSCRAACWNPRWSVSLTLWVELMTHTAAHYVWDLCYMSLVSSNQLHLTLSHLYSMHAHCLTCMQTIVHINTNTQKNVHSHTHTHIWSIFTERLSNHPQLSSKKVHTVEIHVASNNLNSHQVITAFLLEVITSASASLTLFSVFTVKLHNKSKKCVVSTEQWGFTQFCLFS